MRMRRYLHMKTAPISAPLPGYLAVITCPECGHTLDNIYDAATTPLKGEALARCPECTRVWHIAITITAYTVTRQPGRKVYA